MNLRSNRADRILEIHNYRLFRDAKLEDLPRLAVVVGANGSGKSTLFDVFSFLKDALTQNVAHAVARRGGFREVVSRGEAGPIAVTRQVSREPAGAWQRTSSRSPSTRAAGRRIARC